MSRGSGRQPRALGRHRGHQAAPRHRGVYQRHRQTGLHAHPHGYAARQVAATPARAASPGLEGAPPRPLHQYQHTLSDRRLGHARHALASTELGQIIAYDTVSATATVQLLGMPTRVVGPVPVTACAPRDLTLLGAWCLVVLLDAYNPRDGVVAAIWPAPGASSGVKLWQSGAVSIAVVGASTATQAITFPTAYAAAPAVVATAADLAWAATVGAISASGFTLTIRAASPLTATVPVEWVAGGL